ncbi:MAG: GNAT family N-acetyltransferase [Oscillatoriales cyanobacterium RU_3_3]|nr:GNAT family N-acetyltransferase [Oscillatoriales cyanobacterium RU_3_3]NJR23301.1 GNAT family N-acetyltransferase [Richelia sp. CSU_2_1]
MEFRLAHMDNLDEVTRLFDSYRIFYGQVSDLDAARQFIQMRFQQGDSTIFIALDELRGVGFTQLYSSFSSVSMKRVWILNDLFVEETARRQGVGAQLMQAAESFARQTGAVRIALSTQMTNQSAQSLYESRGYVKDEVFYHYSLPL